MICHEHLAIVENRGGMRVSFTMREIQTETATLSGLRGKIRGALSKSHNMRPLKNAPLLPN
jgi:hypothetical protein